MKFLKVHTLKRHWREVSISTALSWLMKLIMLGTVPYELYRGNYLFTLAVVFVVFISLIPSLVQRNYKVTLPFELDLLITLSLFLHTFLGESLEFYQKVWLFDKVLHFYGGAVVALLAFVIAYTLHYTKKVRLTIPLIGFFTVTFAMAVGGLWEIGEFTVDSLFDKTTQNGLADTMWDMIYDLIGGMVSAGLGMAYVRYSKPMAHKRLAKPLGEVFGLGEKVDTIKHTFKTINKELHKDKKKNNKKKRARKGGKKHNG